MHEDEDIFEDEYFEGDEQKSKSQVKREMHALQELGTAISKLTPEQQAQIPIDGSLRDAIEQAPSIKSNSAKKRHMQFIGKLIRGADYEAIEAAYQKIVEASHQLARQHHLVEHWRDTLLSDNETVKDFMDQYPHVDRQQLRQLIRSAEKEKTNNKPPSSARKLFRLIRDTLASESPDNEEAGDSGEIQPGKSWDD
ncbi:MAG: DUF615 domain-containing protein [Agarilytica sp.]